MLLLLLSPGGLRVACDDDLVTTAIGLNESFDNVWIEK